MLEGLNSPLIQDDDGDNKTLKLRFDVSQYAAEEIVLKTVDKSTRKYLRSYSLLYIYIYIVIYHQIGP
jgi:hypothetical protein